MNKAILIVTLSTLFALVLATGCGQVGSNSSGQGGIFPSSLNYQQPAGLN